MSEQLITIVTYIIMVVGTLALEHYHIVPDSTLGYVIAIIGGHAAGTNVLIPSVSETARPNVPQTNSSVSQSEPLSTTFTSSPDYTLLPTTQMPAVQVSTQRKTINPQDQGQKG